MGVRVVCISRAIAAGGESIGRAVAERLGYRYVDEQIIARAAREARVDPAVVARAEQRQPRLQQLLDKLPSARGIVAAMGLAAGVPLDAFGTGPSDYRAVPEDMRTLIRAAIHEIARAGDAVIVAHAASMALGGGDGVLRILVTASPETRAARLAQAQSLGATAAAAAVAASDRDRQDYFQRFYQIHNEHPTHYDVTINTDLLGGQQVVDVILSAAGAGARAQVRTG